MFFLSFSTWWSQMSGFEQFFWGLAVVSSILFVVFFVISLVGVDLDSEAEIGETSVDAEDQAYQVDPFFKLLSFRSVTAFLTFFSWAGILAISQDYGRFWILLWAIAAGLAAMFLVAYLMYFFASLAETGTAQSAELLEKKGVVYLTIPANNSGKGKVHVVWNHSLRELDAMTSGDAITNGTQVRILKVLKDNVVLVEDHSKATAQVINS